ncbi:hypothetical protein O5D80_005051 [Batrachochytrium dendrobatidis]|nr:hypothetical protein O5D80_005051 [Batrachochytrium dendrobatidis]
MAKVREHFLMVMIESSEESNSPSHEFNGRISREIINRITTTTRKISLRQTNNSRFFTFDVMAFNTTLLVGVGDDEENSISFCVCSFA